MRKHTNDATVLLSSHRVEEIRNVISDVAIMEALKAGDEAQASHLLEQHIKRFQEEIQTAIMGVS